MHRKENAEFLWNYLHDKYSSPGPASVFADYQHTRHFQISGNSDPAPQIAELDTLYTRLEGNKCNVPFLIRAITLLSLNLGITWPPLSLLPRPCSPSWLRILWAQLSSLSSSEDQPVLILLVTQVFLKMIVLPLGRRIPRISSSSSSHKKIPPSSKRKNMVKESVVVKHTKQMALPNLLIMIMLHCTNV